MVEAKLPPGFRFHPKDDELVCDYLMGKVVVADPQDSPQLMMIEVDLNKCEPWDIPEIACVGGKEWYFYSQRDRKYATGLRTNRATASGYWKATGKDRPIYRKAALVGMRKTLVFYQGRAPKGRKTDWVMHEFRIEGPLGPPKITSLKEDWVLCRVSFKNREVASKPSYFGLDRGTPSDLPPLMDSAYISFDSMMATQTQQQPAGNDVTSEYDDDEQVPCFSSILFSQLPHPISFPQLEFLNAVPTTKSSSGTTDVNYVSSAPLAAASSFIGSSISSSSSSAMAVDHHQLGLGGSCILDSRNYYYNSSSSSNNNNNSYSSSSDKKVLKAVLNQLTEMEANSINNNNVSLGDGTSSAESFMSEVGMPATAACSHHHDLVWAHY
ncbi:hypothetical protein CDL15_Pgr002300 [Punica granatum]|nr:hypothetical protein CDL15_Pgr002300 [Punica granatum]